MPTTVSRAVYESLYVPCLQSCAVITYLEVISINKLILSNFIIISSID